uniref:Secreted protein n=1 Tax=Wuchereria bancrofti TaxID=6293 RepID=A0AAF5PLA1_WUCBA
MLVALGLCGMVETLRAGESVLGRDVRQVCGCQMVKWVVRRFLCRSTYTGCDDGHRNAGIGVEGSKVHNFEIRWKRLSNPHIGLKTIPELLRSSETQEHPRDLLRSLGPDRIEQPGYSVLENFRRKLTLISKLGE